MSGLNPYLAAAAKLFGKMIGSIICLIVFSIAGALYGFLFPWIDTDKIE